MSSLPRDREKVARMEKAVRVLIRGLGEELDREGLRDTPKRVAKALLDCTQGYLQDTSSTLGTALFHEPIVHQGGEGVVLVRDIDFASTSEETLLPFHGRCHVAYRPKDGVVLGLSKLVRLTKQYAKRLQTQERLAAAIALALQQSLECYGVAIVLQARHLSNNAPPEERTNACVTGGFASKDSADFEEMLALLDLECLSKATIGNLDCGSLPSAHVVRHMASCDASAAAPDPGFQAPGMPDPSEKDTGGESDDLVFNKVPCCSKEMEAAVQQLLAEVGENPHRQGLVGSARRYVMSLLASTSGYRMHLPLTKVSRHQPQPHLIQHRKQRQASCGQASSRENRDMDGEGRACGEGLEEGSAAADGCALSDFGMGRRCYSDLVGNGVLLATGPLCGAVTLRLPFTSQCEHHMLPFYGTIMVAYLQPGGPSGGATLSRGLVEQLVLMFTQRLQVQERITHQVADAVEKMLQAAVASAPSIVLRGGSVGDRDSTAGVCHVTERSVQSGMDGGVMVVCDAAHMCMVARGVENHSGSTTTFAVRGVFATRPELRRVVLRMFQEPI